MPMQKNPETLSWQIPRLLHFLLRFLGRRCSCWSWLLIIRKDLCRVACFCLIYIYIPYFWWNYIHSLFFFWYILLWIPACLELVFLFLKKEFTLFSVFSFKETIDFGRSRKNNTVEKRPESSQRGFWWEKPCISPVVTKYTIKWESDGRKVSKG